VIGTIELLGLLPAEFSGLHGGFWNAMAGFDINKAGFVIVGMFVVTWAVALAFWKFRRVEERWSARVVSEPVAGDSPEQPER
jgi:nickel/cobalt transporter (NiCoT) family protein